jgi:hypothetical protein
MILRDIFLIIRQSDGLVLGPGVKGPTVNKLPGGQFQLIAGRVPAYLLKKRET